MAIKVHGFFTYNKSCSLRPLLNLKEQEKVIRPPVQFALSSRKKFQSSFKDVRNRKRKLMYLSALSTDVKSINNWKSKSRMISQEKIDKSCTVVFLVSQKTSMKFNSWFGQFIPDLATRHYNSFSGSGIFCIDIIQCAISIIICHAKPWQSDKRIILYHKSNSEWKQK